MTAIKFTNKSDFIDAVNGKRRQIQARDRAIAAEARKAERVWLAEYHRLTREATKHTYAEATKEPGYKNPIRCHLDHRPECRTYLLPRLDALLNVLEMTQQKEFTVDPNGQWATAWTILTYNPDAAPSSPCEEQ